MTDVCGSDAKPEFQSRYSDKEVRQRYPDSPSQRLAIDPTSAESDCHCHWLYQYAGKQLIDEPLSLLSTLNGMSTGNSVGEFQHRYNRDCEVIIARFECDGLKELPRILYLTFCGNRRR